MTKAKRPLKSIKKPKAVPTHLSVGEVLEIEGLNNELAVLRERTKEFKSSIDKVELKKKVHEQEIIIQQLNLQDARQKLRDHGQRVQEKEKALKNFRDRLCERYNVQVISYNPDTLEIVKEP